MHNACIISTCTYYYSYSSTAVTLCPYDNADAYSYTLLCVTSAESDIEVDGVPHNPPLIQEPSKDTSPRPGPRFVQYIVVLTPRPGISYIRHSSSTSCSPCSYVYLYLEQTIIIIILLLLFLK